MALPVYLRLDGALVASQPDDAHDWITIEEAARIVREHNEAAAVREQNPGAPLEQIIRGAIEPPTDPKLGWFATVRGPRGRCVAGKVVHLSLTTTKRGT